MIFVVIPRSYFSIGLVGTLVGVCVMLRSLQRGWSFDSGLPQSVDTRPDGDDSVRLRRLTGANGVSAVETQCARDLDSLAYSRPLNARDWREAKRSFVSIRVVSRDRRCLLTLAIRMTNSRWISVGGTGNETFAIDC